MRPVKRYSEGKRRSAGKFRRNVRKTKAMNLRMPMRGGYRI